MGQSKHWKQNWRARYFVKKRKPFKAYLTKENQDKPAGLRAGPQTIITPVVKEFASQFKLQKGKPLVALATEIAMHLKNKFASQYLPPEHFARLYAKRTAEDIIKSKVIVKCKIAPASHGCVDYAVALCAVFRAKGIPSLFVRTGVHSFVVFETDEVKYCADPTRDTADKIVTVFGDVHERAYGPRARRMLFKLGADAWSLGIKSIKDFYKYF